MKLFLIGYMGSGKSSVGRRLSEKLKMDFIDFDDHIEKEYGKTITEIFDTEGEEKFRELEHQHLKTFLKKNNIIVSLGGGTPCYHNNIELINENSISVYIEMSVDALVKRLAKAKNKRPLIRDMNEFDLKFFIESNLKKRIPIYRKAHISINAENLSEEQLAEIIVKSLEGIENRE
ncbi:MAG: shikimate kinase [Bacteroidota bacterium]